MAAQQAGPGLKARLTAWIVNRALDLANRKANLAEVQKRHNAFQGRVCQMRVTDLNQVWHFRLGDGRLEYIRAPGKVHGGFELSSDVIIGLVLGKRLYADPSDPKRTWEAAYTPLDAVNYGEVRIWGDAVSNDMLLLSRHIYREIYEPLKDELAMPLESARGANGASTVGNTAKPPQGSNLSPDLE